ncbi:hypothetical protein GEV33_002271 [Tenebrio molitor]|uniref:Uncharacterized protein n=1 Tax=Tenebrio molitor TaxID=7067 RepID=A0A8J6LG60_TENMO|nr:hypothetical protein GEV33_002271 [Tenebrio molitor]
MKGRNRQTYFSKDFGIWQTSHDIFGCIDSIAETILNSTKLQELIDDPNRKFDLIMMELLHPVLFGFAARFEAPSIGISTGSLFSYKYDATGHLQHPGVYCDQFLNVRTLSLGGKFQSIASFLWCKFYYQWVFFPRAHGMATKYFGKVPYDLQKILDEATAGFVYLNLGSNNIDQKLRTIITEALAELPYTVLWKWESDRLPGKPSDGVIRNWLPQQDVLAHCNVKAFVTQGNIQSVQEAIFREIL